MAQKSVHIVVSIFLVVALIMPAVLSLIVHDRDRIALVNVIEEEPGKEDSKEQQEMDVYFEWSRYASPDLRPKDPVHSFFYLFKSSDFLVRIILPPPEVLS